MLLVLLGDLDLGLHFWQWSTDRTLRVFGVGVLGAGIILGLGIFFEMQFPEFKRFRGLLKPYIQDIPPMGILYLAFLSGFFEELLFRGALQPFAGILLTSILFGAIHLGPGGLSLWSLWAVFSGFLMGLEAMAAKSILAPALTHVIVNCVSMLRLKYSFKPVSDDSVSAHIRGS